MWAKVVSINLDADNFAVCRVWDSNPQALAGNGV
jgi:hypothetical protein